VSPGAQRNHRAPKDARAPAQPSNGGGRARTPNGKGRWEEILTAAAKTFAEKGYVATSLQDIASAVGLLKGSIYYYIESKEDLLFELVQRGVEAHLPILQEDATTAAAAAPVRLRAFIRGWMALTRTERIWSRVAEQEFRRLRPARLRQVIAERDKFSALVKSIVEQGIKDGDFDPQTDPSVATNALFALMATTGNWFKPSGRLSYGEIADWYAEFFIRGLAGPRLPTDQ
jgi:AcrR family transcriptional regulator